MSRFKTAVVPFATICPDCSEEGKMVDGSFECLNGKCGKRIDSETVVAMANAGRPLHRSMKKRG